MSKPRSYHLSIWRQEQGATSGRLVDYSIENIRPEQSFLEMLDVLNEQLLRDGQDPIAVESDCREGICGMCGLVIDGVAHGPVAGTTTCGLRMRLWPNGAHIVIEPFRAASFPVIKDLVVDRSALDRIISRGGYVSVNTGGAPEANMIPVGQVEALKAFDAATCIGCGACAAACPNASASLFTSAKISQYSYLPQGQVEADRRTLRMVNTMDEEGFGDCSNHAECEAVCPKRISVNNIARMRRAYLKALARK